MIHPATVGLLLMAAAWSLVSLPVGLFVAFAALAVEADVRISSRERRDAERRNRNGRR